MKNCIKKLDGHSVTVRSKRISRFALLKHALKALKDQSCPRGTIKISENGKCLNFGDNQFLMLPEKDAHKPRREIVTVMSNQFKLGNVYCDSKNFELTSAGVLESENTIVYFDN